MKEHKNTHLHTDNPLNGCWSSEIILKRNSRAHRFDTFASQATIPTQSTSASPEHLQTTSHLRNNYNLAKRPIPREGHKAKHRRQALQPSANMSDAEDDYMNMTFTDAAPSAPKTSLQRQQERRRLASLKSQPKTKKELEKEAELARETALATSTLSNPSSKGALMMAKMGFKGGALGKSANARTEPIEISIKEGKGGIGMDNEKKRKIREQMEELQGKEKRQKAEAGEYRERVAREREEKRKEGQWWGAMKVCEKFDTEEEVEKSGKESKKDKKKVNLLWRTLALQRDQRDKEKVLRKGALDSLSSRWTDDEADADDKVAMGVEVEDLEDEEDTELEEFNALEVGERLEKTVRYLRSTYHYCFWCKYRYADETMEGCPGLTEEEHD
ncbi:uncharacterized protein M437DRAFT_50213 [Aureobasidium melanogenum CBS 110374]|uniref:G-patch domain-containing protein n=1 Tax=Aureobasidium melanogenum (strain CBS 110374) TaxID=1043003 RepID=A0A074VNB9_AURM1|nr:uncharacterized protein M437DRAFT_50213 [Aureobasidium melanogenum CBS 110374]KEQ62195.1 hypothetical protein M437DRAFT_50213 [Aureobasidium melanogenum CBS 110374]